MISRLLNALSNPSTRRALLWRARRFFLTAAAVVETVLHDAVADVLAA